MAASLFDHPGILLIIAAITLLRWLMQKGKGETPDTETPPPRPDRPIPRGGETNTEEERIRKFLEALGQPPGTTPPKVLPRRRQVVEPRIFPRLPRLKTAPPPLPQATEVDVPTPPPLPIEVATQRTASALESDFEVREVARQTSSEPLPEIHRTAAFAAGIKLGTPQDLRTAIVLREIFGPPRSLQPLNLTSGF